MTTSVLSIFCSEHISCHPALYVRAHFEVITHTEKTINVLFSVLIICPAQYSTCFSSCSAVESAMVIAIECTS